MLIQRTRKGDSWSWQAETEKLRPGHARVATDKWEAWIVGSCAPDLPGWLESSLAHADSPSDIMVLAREKDEGHYALVCVNRTGDAVHLCSDPYAIAKLYWWSAEGRFVIGTDLPDVLRAVSRSPLDLDVNACGYFFMCGYLPGRHTFHRNVFKVPPAVVWRIVKGEKEERRYVDLMAPADLSSDAYMAGVSAAWRASITRHLDRFPRPIVALSGGVDSTLLLASMKKIGGGNSALVARTGISLGGEASTVLNPYDRMFARRAAKDLGVPHEEVQYDFCGPQLPGHLSQAIGVLGAETHVGTLLFRSLGDESLSSGSALFAAQNADSIFSFAISNRPRLDWSWPHVVGLGGWCTRYNLMGGFDRPGGWDQWAARFLFDRFLRRRFEVSLSSLRPADRAVGLVFDEQKWPAPPNNRNFPHVRNVDEIAGWLLGQYWHGEISRCFERNPHGAFLQLFLDNYMQGTANRGTVCYPTAMGTPTFLPFASISILRLTSRLRPEPGNFWFGKLPVIRMAKSEYAVPDYVLRRSDPSTPELDRLYYESILSNDGVAEHFEEMLHRCPETVDRLKTVLLPGWLNRVGTHLRKRELEGADARWAIFLYWLLEVEQQAWGAKA